jgi:hypothetical protein
MRQRQTQTCANSPQGQELRYIRSEKRASTRVPCCSISRRTIARQRFTTLHNHFKISSRLIHSHLRMLYNRTAIVSSLHNRYVVNLRLFFCDFAFALQSLYRLSFSSQSLCDQSLHDCFGLTLHCIASPRLEFTAQPNTQCTYQTHNVRTWPCPVGYPSGSCLRYRAARIPRRRSLLSDRKYLGSWPCGEPAHVCASLWPLPHLLWDLSAASSHQLLLLSLLLWLLLRSQIQKVDWTHKIWETSILTSVTPRLRMWRQIFGETF